MIISAPSTHTSPTHLLHPEHPSTHLLRVPTPQRLAQFAQIGRKAQDDGNTGRRQNGSRGALWRYRPHFDPGGQTCNAHAVVAFAIDTRFREVNTQKDFGAPSTTRTCDLLVRRATKGVNRGQQEAAAPRLPSGTSLLAPPDTTGSRNRLSVICQSTFRRELQVRSEPRVGSLAAELSGDDDVRVRNTSSTARCP
jgi:hypothetical protein